MTTFYDWLKQGNTMIPNQLFNHYADLNLNSDEFVLITYLLSRLTQGESVDELEFASSQLGWPRPKLMDVVNSLMTKKYLSLELKPNPDGKQTDHFSLRPLFETINERFFESTNSVKEDARYHESQNLVASFETEFGRPLSPIELEKLSNWINKDQFKVDLIKIALREAVIHQALSFNYIDRILLNWRKKNIQTVMQAEKEIYQFQEKMQQKQQPNHEFPEINIPKIDWNRG
ncbi:DnaD domain-containing protein [Ignavigranum ruoffiae]|uniref:DnaD domain-containing protein n=1 Tax=Ignavigranum ruoffiae TaxID=89093 RepID=UPI0024AE4880|nr:DnaD domain protein [Ignavigranum ruoffiae]